LHPPKPVRFDDRYADVLAKTGVFGIVKTEFFGYTTPFTFPFLAARCWAGKQQIRVWRNNEEWQVERIEDLPEDLQEKVQTFYR